MKSDKKRNDDLPVMYDSEKIITRTSWYNNEIQVAEIGNYISVKRLSTFALIIMRSFSSRKARLVQ